MKTNAGKRIRKTSQCVTLHKMLMSGKLNFESLIIREDACFLFFLSQLKIILICVHLHGTEFLMNLSEYYLLIAYLLFLKIQAML